MDFKKLERELRNNQLYKDMKVVATVIGSFYSGCKDHANIGTKNAHNFTSHLIQAIFARNKSNKNQQPDLKEEKQPDLNEIEQEQRELANIICSYYLECKQQKNITKNEAQKLTKTFIFSMINCN
ncbi:MAG: hypothetical protein MI740_10365 [Halanaerobiales bacterium]|nr:hypothetical protein [Halanaerobiales bacterium]